MRTRPFHNPAPRHEAKRCDALFRTCLTDTHVLVYIGPTMTTAEHPITRAELRGEIDDLLHREFADLRREFREHYATKEDLAKLETRLIKWIVGK